MEVLSTETIQSTEVYQNLIKKKNTIAASLLLKRNVRSLVTNGLMVYRNTGHIPEHLTSHNLQIVIELYEKYKAGN